MSQARSGFPLNGLLRRRSRREVARPAGRDHGTSRPQEDFRTERLLRWYLLVWVGLVSLLGLSELINQTVPGGWTACLTAEVKPKWCDLFTRYFSQGISPLPDLDFLLRPMLPAIVTFTVLMLLFSTSLWIGLSGKRKARFSWLFFPLQGMLVFALSLFIPQVGVTVPLSLYLALILEACAILKSTRLVIAVAGGSLLLFILSIVLVIGQGWDFSADSSFGTVVALVLLVVGFLFAVGFLTVYLQLARAHSQIEIAYAKLEEAHVQLQAASERIEVLTLANERQRMARELHDTLAQGLVGLTLQLETVDALLTEEHSHQAQEIVRKAMQRARATLATARGAIGDLRAETFDAHTFLDGVQEEIGRFTTATGIPCYAELEVRSLLPSPLYEQVLRVIGEGLTNIARHAQAHHAEVHIREENARLMIELCDDGIGFDPIAVMTSTGHYGLLGLRERARLLGGHLEIQSVPGEGTVLRFSFPYTSEENKGHRVRAALPAGEGKSEEV